MGIAPYKTFTFDGVSSGGYSVYITGEGVFNAPERSVEVISIPGRNGAYILDKGCFENVEVTYHAGMYDYNEANFAQKVADLRNWLCSKVGYCRLEDEYNTGEYRMAVYKSGLEVEHEGLINGEFDITFECKPQRFLTSGETKQTITSGSTITNPTLFPSRPMLELTGYGDISVGGETISVLNQLTGDVLLNGGESFPNEMSATIVTNASTFANGGDVITVDRVMFSGGIFRSSSSVGALSNPFWAGPLDDGTNPYYWGGSVTGKTSTGFSLSEYIADLTFTFGTASTISVNHSYTVTTANYGTLTNQKILLSLAYDGADTFTLSATPSLSTYLKMSATSYPPMLSIGSITLDSTQTAYGNPSYIDLDTGEAYKIVNTHPISINGAVIVPAELPTLPSGASTITFDNTFTQVKITPRWWKV